MLGVAKASPFEQLTRRQWCLLDKKYAINARPTKSLSFA